MLQGIRHIIKTVLTFW